MKKHHVLTSINADGVSTTYVDADDLDKGRVRLFGADLLCADNIVKVGTIKRIIFLEITVIKKVKGIYTVEIHLHPNRFDGFKGVTFLGIFTGKMREIKTMLTNKYKDRHIKYLKSNPQKREMLKMLEYIYEHNSF